MMMGLSLVGMLLFWGLFLAVIVAGVVFLFRQFGGQRPHEESDTALRVLNDRLARGEITPEEYQVIRARLSQ